MSKRWLPQVACAWAGVLVSTLATNAASYAMIWHLTVSTGSPLVLALAYVCAFLPMGLLSPLGGVAADRFNRRNIVIICDLGIAVFAAAFAAIAWAGLVSAPVIMAWCCAFSVFSAFRQPAFDAAMPLVVPEEHLIRINTLNGIKDSLSMIVAPALGILLYTTLGLYATSLVDMAGALVAAACMFPLAIPTVRSEESRGITADLAQGLRALSGTKGLLLLTIFMALGMFMYGPLDSLIPLVVSGHFGGDGFAASFVSAAFGIGMLVGSIALMALGSRLPLTRVIAACCVCVGAASIVWGMLPANAYPAYVVSVALMAITCAGFGPPLMTLMQTKVPPESLGCVMGLFSAMLGLAVPLGTALGGAVAEGIGILPFFLVDGGLILALSLPVIFSPSIRSLDGGADLVQTQGRETL